MIQASSSGRGRRCHAAGDHPRAGGQRQPGAEDRADPGLRPDQPGALVRVVHVDRDVGGAGSRARRGSPHTARRCRTAPGRRPGRRGRCRPRATGPPASPPRPPAPGNRRRCAHHPALGHPGRPPRCARKHRPTYAPARPERSGKPPIREAASSGRNRPGLKSANLLKGSVVYTQNPPTPAEASPAVTFAHGMTLRPIRDGAHRSKRLKALAGTCRDIWKVAGISRDLP